MTGSWGNKEMCYDRHCKLVFLGTDGNIKYQGHIKYEKFMQKTTIGRSPWGDVYNSLKDFGSSKQVSSGISSLWALRHILEDVSRQAVAWTSVPKGPDGRSWDLQADVHLGRKPVSFNSDRVSHIVLFYLVLYFKFQIVKIRRFLHKQKPWHCFFQKLEGET